MIDDDDLKENVPADEMNDEQPEVEDDYGPVEQIDETEPEGEVPAPPDLENQNEEPS